MKVGLFILRGQPLHVGHMYVLQKMIDTQDIAKVIIGIGSSQYSNTEDNPFDLMERTEMIINGLDELHNPLGKIIDVFAIKDIHNPPVYVSHVNHIVDKYDVIYTGNDLMKRLFQEAGVEVRWVNRSKEISGTMLREMIAKGNPSWKKYVPESTIRVLNEIDLKERFNFRPV
jgi:nicotinamide-nucleotide adenylyltransferase